MGIYDYSRQKQRGKKSEVLYMHRQTETDRETQTDKETQTDRDTETERQNHGKQEIKKEQTRVINHFKVKPRQEITYSLVTCCLGTKHHLHMEFLFLSFNLYMQPEKKK